MEPTLIHITERSVSMARSTGEFASLTLDERESVAEIARSNWPGRQFINISSCNVQDSLRLLNHSQQVKDHLKACLSFVMGLPAKRVFRLLGVNCQRRSPLAVWPMLVCCCLAGGIISFVLHTSINGLLLELGKCRVGGA